MALELCNKVGDIYETRNYDMFKRLEWNRAVTNARKEKIKRSIIKEGYVMSPICVNEEGAIIDGQGRVDALRDLDMPVHYYVVPGAGREQCIAMNVNGTPWKIQDYIDSYASDNEDYKRFVQIQKEFTGKGISLDAFLFAMRNTTADGRTIKDGHLKCSEDDMLRAIERLRQLEKYIPYIKKIVGNRAYAQVALLFVLGLDNVNDENLFARMQTNIKMLAPITTIAGGCEAFSDLYNYNRKKEKVYWKTDYDKWLHDNLPSYGNRWGKEHRAKIEQQSLEGLK